MKSYATAVLVLLVVFAGSACGRIDAPPQTRPSTNQPGITDAPAGFNAEETAFATAMVTLFGRTTELTALVPKRSGKPERSWPSRPMSMSRNGLTSR